MVTVGGVKCGAQVTWVSPEVEAKLRLLAASLATPAGIVAITVPGDTVMPVTLTVYVVPDPVTTAVVAAAVPLNTTSPVAKLATGSSKTTVNRIVEPVAGSVWL